MKIESIKALPVLKIYDPALCCSSGVCGVDADQTLIEFSADLDWLKRQGVQVERFNLAQEPMAFAENETVKSFLQTHGADNLPLVLRDELALICGAYPTRAQLATWFELSLEDAVEQS
ncbi:MAG: arsenite efflux transporter metallochaperone ArsD, partial [Vibrio sp.]